MFDLQFCVRRWTIRSVNDEAGFLSVVQRAEPRASGFGVARPINRVSKPDLVGSTQYSLTAGW